LELKIKQLETEKGEFEHKIEKLGTKKKENLNRKLKI